MASKPGRYKGGGCADCGGQVKAADEATHDAWHARFDLLIERVTRWLGSLDLKP